jgi:hypothetical protein
MYLADRALDIRAPGPTANTARHRYYRRHPSRSIRAPAQV